MSADDADIEVVRAQVFKRIAQVVVLAESLAMIEQAEHEAQIRKQRAISASLCSTPEGVELLKRAVLTPEEREISRAIGKSNSQQPRHGSTGRWRRTIPGIEALKGTLPWRHVEPKALRIW